MVKKKRKKKRKMKEPTWEESMKFALKYVKPILDKLRDYDLGKVKR